MLFGKYQRFTIFTKHMFCKINQFHFKTIFVIFKKISSTTCLIVSKVINRFESCLTSIKAYFRYASASAVSKSSLNNDRTTHQYFFTKCILFIQSEHDFGVCHLFIFAEERLKHPTMHYYESAFCFSRYIP